MEMLKYKFCLFAGNTYLKYCVLNHFQLIDDFVYKNLYLAYLPILTLFVFTDVLLVISTFFLCGLVA